jgi:menaquinone-dependent protoporphyrinogen oxidase
MRTLIVYASRHGYVRECAQRISEGLGTETNLVEVSRTMPKDLLFHYDTVIIGGGIHAGSFPPLLKRFCRRNIKELSNKRLGLYLCATNSEHKEEQFSKSYPQVLLEKAVATGWFGGRIILADHKNVTLFILKKILNKDTDLHAELPNEVEAFIKHMQKDYL